jgi:hypothetical protein
VTAVNKTDDSRLRVSVLMPPTTTERFRRLLSHRRAGVAGEPLVRLSRHALALHALELGLNALEAEAKRAA